MKKPKNKEGRKPVITESVLEKLKGAFLMGCSDKEACLIAGISEGTLYNYQKANPEFIKEKELYKTNPIAEARTSVLKHMKHDGDLALKLLERVKKDEFSLRHELSGSNGEPIEFKWVDKE